MSSADVVEPDRPDAVDHDTVPPARTGLLVLAAVLLSLPVIARPHRPMDDLGAGREWAAPDASREEQA